MISLKKSFLLVLIGLVIAGWGGGILSVHYIIGNSSPINSINAIGMGLIVVGLAVTIKSLSVIKPYFEVIEE